MSADRFEELLSRWENGAATDPDLREIDALLRASPDHRNTFLQRTLLEVDLHETYSGEIAEAARQLPRPDPVRRFRGGRLGVAWAAGVLLAILIGTLFFMPGAPPPTSPAASAGPHRLEDGSVVEFKPGSRYSVRGPVEDIRQVIELHEGAGTFRVGKGTQAFQVRTPHGWVTTSAADFEVEIPRPGGLSVRVALGEVEASHGERRRLLSAGQAHVFEAVVPKPPRGETPVKAPPRGERPVERKKPGETRPPEEKR